MAKTDFSYGDVVDESFFDLIFDHVHDGVDDDGHCPPISLDNHDDGVSPAHISGILPEENLPLLRAIGFRHGFNMEDYNSGDSWGVIVQSGAAISNNSSILDSRDFNPLIINTSALTKMLINSSGTDWEPYVAGNGNGGVPTTASGWSQAIADNIWIHVFILGDLSDRDSCEVGFDTSLSAVNLREVSGYQFYKRLGSVLLDYDSSKYSIVPFFSIDRRFCYKNNNPVPSLDVYGTLSTTETLLTIPVPSGVIVNALLRARIIKNADPCTAHLLITDYNCTYDTSSWAISSLTSHADTVSGEFRHLTNTSQQIKVAYVSSDAVGDVTVSCFGWEEI